MQRFPYKQVALNAATHRWLHHPTRSMADRRLQLVQSLQQRCKRKPNIFQVLRPCVWWTKRIFSVFLGYFLIKCFIEEYLNHHFPVSFSVVSRFIVISAPVSFILTRFLWFPVSLLYLPLSPFLLRCNIISVILFILFKNISIQKQRLFLRLKGILQFLLNFNPFDRFLLQALFRTTMHFVVNFLRLIVCTKWQCQCNREW